MPREDSWSVDEIASIVDTYRKMLIAELSHQRYNKAALNRQLAERLPRRSSGSIEFKHCNISAVLRDAGCPYVAGYKPRSNYQAILAECVEQRLLRSEVFDRAALSAAERPVIDNTPETLEGVVVDPPQTTPQVRERQGGYVVKRDYLAREARNRELGHAGECFVLAYERQRLMAEGTQKLAEAVEHVAATQGDGMGFDVRSFSSDGSERLIEVKTTAFAKECAFFLSPNELDCSGNNAARYYLYRLFNFRDQPRMFCLRGDLRDHLWLEPDSYRAGVR
ncbi:DUF3883 domain-containing protein [Chromohalobacter canadensis]|uniref:DUF3883 domain-containing protein n=1 Tax=Chromohalobacter canadensis TaxID=141389 RepID=A0A285VAR7_9GAMM|nr:DUF3883 domain-containing protein [Chromohalobacter canadensis]MCK0769328.1 DUF3883 domain-containing protein [Chromohalobacter canadensis]WQH10617.1 DUF3883 domain-containing protein [Chromohalobacter canadensis]SOC51184.1 protein of unknown function [Chromohalobacter canadensis]